MVAAEGACDHYVIAAEGACDHDVIAAEGEGEEVSTHAAEGACDAWAWDCCAIVRNIYGLPLSKQE